MAKRLRTPDPSQLQLSEQTSSPPAKVTVSDDPQPQLQPMWCSLPPHRDTIAFASYNEYESHYLRYHVNRCSECGKNFPTQHILDIHIEEHHDPLILARRDRGEKTFSCFVEGCERKCSTAQKRRRHLIDKHMFPRSRSQYPPSIWPPLTSSGNIPQNYNFYIVNDGIDKQNSLLRTSNNNNHFRRRSLQQSPQEGRLRNRKTSVSSSVPLVPDPGARADTNISMNDAHTDEIDALTSSLSALKFVPASVTKRLESDRRRTEEG
ncbi:hypothetical protein UA08_07130 [Talaromyces atroroseus]|uniref:C2H2-type domain-containing protein n=1 Tax=Talaromyces atroroseus TaxID=1441469 RepID=A0A225AEQ1_TALAT|nr:hypothetical protein UA08_07130 [Talaromyces atroroseus]OKL57553.1 hypothetical protein UA08_07130 [Talaromyces atroroseus]